MQAFTDKHSSTMAKDTACIIYEYPICHFTSFTLTIGFVHPYCMMWLAYILYVLEIFHLYKNAMCNVAIMIQSKYVLHSSYSRSTQNVTIALNKEDVVVELGPEGFCNFLGVNIWSLPQKCPLKLA